MPKSKVYIIGVAPSGATSLQPETRRMIDHADMVFGGERLIEMFPELSGQKVIIGNNLSEVAQMIKNNLEQKQLIVLSSGDPGFYGIAKYLTNKLGKDNVEIIPNISSLQLAFARIKESWDDASLLSVHSRPIEEIFDVVCSSRKIGILTDDRNRPDIIARFLMEKGFENCKVHICQDLGSDKEKITTTNLNSLAGMQFAPLNIMILIRDSLSVSIPNTPRQILGIGEDEFLQRAPGKSLITKLEIRAISLAKMELTENSIVWDIGAGSGAVSIEASLLAHKGYVFAIEKTEEQVAIIRRNIEKFKRSNLHVIHDTAPSGLDALPDPTAVFIGGSGGQIGPILEVACNHLKDDGRIVINAITIENLNAAFNELKDKALKTEITLVSISRSKEILDLTRLEGLNPVFILTGRKETRNGLT
jgi:precorrin-6Y C5,15-methyltransferase (decarboxylating)